jgi:hypothetical protein
MAKKADAQLVRQPEAPALTGAVGEAAKQGFTFARYFKLEVGQWISGRFLGFGVREALDKHGDDETNPKTGEVKSYKTIMVETGPGTSLECAAGYQVVQRLSAADVVPGLTEVWIRRGDDVRTPAGRMVTEYAIGVRNNKA